MAYSFLSGTRFLIDWMTGAGMSPFDDQPLNWLSSGIRPFWATMPASWLTCGLETSGGEPARIAVWSFWSCWAIGMPTYWTVMVGLAASKRRMSSCHTGVRSGPAFVSQNVMVTGPVLVVAAVLPLPLPQPTARIATRPAARVLKFFISRPPPLLVYSVHEVTRTIMAAVSAAVNRAGILGARTGGHD